MNSAESRDIRKQIGILQQSIEAILVTKLNSPLLPGSHLNRLDDDLYSRIGNSDTGSARGEGRSDSNKSKEEEDRFHHRACVIFVT